MWKLCQPRSRSRIKCFRFLILRCCPGFKRFSCQSAGDADSKVVKLSVGSVKGRRLSGIYGDEFYSFEGIPFAKPPLGKARFVASQLADPWNSELDARQERPIPLQMDRRSGKVVGSEDCLYLNVYTKHVSISSQPKNLAKHLLTGQAIVYKLGLLNLRFCKRIIEISGNTD